MSIVSRILFTWKLNKIQHQYKVIFETLQILTEQVNNYLNNDDENLTVLGNVAVLDSDPEKAGEMTNKIVLSLINVQEENTLKNFSNTSSSNNLINHKYPKINLNLFVLFSANRNTYTQSLSDISKIITFFQGKKVFTQANSIYNREDLALENIENFHFRMELYTPSFEDLNYIWGTLGGKQLPSVMYKLSLIQIDASNILTQTGSINEMQGTAQMNN